MWTLEAVRNALTQVVDPELRRSIVDLGMVQDLRVEDGVVSFTLALTTLACPLRESIVEQARQAVLALDGVRDVRISLREMTPEEKARIWPREQSQPQKIGVAAHLNHIDRVLAVMSGKGGVGKSSLAALLAAGAGAWACWTPTSPAPASPGCLACGSHRPWARWGFSPPRPRPASG